MRKIFTTMVIVVLASITLQAKVKYVGDKRAEYYYNNEKAAKYLAKNYTGNEPIVLYYVKERNGRREFSNESRCCSSLSLAGGQCFSIQDSKLIKEVK